MSTAAPDKTEIKTRIRALQKDVTSHLSAKDAIKAKRVRRKIKRLKRATRQLAKQKPAAAAKAG